MRVAEKLDWKGLILSTVFPTQSKPALGSI
jgi:hypothetical protein